MIEINDWSKILEPNRNKRIEDISFHHPRKTDPENKVLHWRIFNKLKQASLHTLWNVYDRLTEGKNIEGISTMSIDIIISVLKENNFPVLHWGTSEIENSYHFSSRNNPKDKSINAAAQRAIKKAQIYTKDALIACIGSGEFDELEGISEETKKIVKRVVWEDQKS